MRQHLEAWLARVDETEDRVSTAEHHAAMRGRHGRHGCNGVLSIQSLIGADLLAYNRRNRSVNTRGKERENRFTLHRFIKTNN